MFLSGAREAMTLDEMRRHLTWMQASAQLCLEELNVRTKHGRIVRAHLLDLITHVLAARDSVDALRAGPKDE